jgi:hypothetical protein
MLRKVDVGRYCCAPSTNLQNYRSLVGDGLIDEVHRLAESLRGVRVCHINATAAGGGVAELLERMIPIYQALGIQCDWRLIHGDQSFFAITKGFHNALQGAEFRCRRIWHSRPRARPARVSAGATGTRRIAADPGCDCRQDVAKSSPLAAW